MIFQQFHLLMQKTALENVCFPMLISGVSKAKAKERAKELLELVGLADRMDSYPSQLSGGERQRVAIARSMARQPKILIADEPTGNLDTKSSNEVMEILKRSNRELNQTIIMITHNMELAKATDRIIRIEDGRLI